MKKRSWLAWLVLVMTVFAFMGGGCGGGGGGSGDSGVNDDVVQPVVYEPGEEVLVASVVIGGDGGVIEAGGDGTPIDGVSVTFPPGALMTDTEVSIGYNTGSLTPNEGKYYGANIVLNVEDTMELNFPAEITVPLHREALDLNEKPIPYYIDDNGNLCPCQFIGIDKDKNTYTFTTFHASTYSCIYYDDSEEATPSHYAMNTGFSPSVDGFRIKNVEESTYAPGGSCFGMASFSLWYFQNIKSTKGNFYPKYSVVAQELTAIRSRLSMYQKETWSHIHQNADYSDISRFKQIIAAMDNSGPVLVNLFESEEWNPESDTFTVPSNIKGHTVLAYAYKVSANWKSGEISVCDSNYPGDHSRKIILEDGKFNVYKSSWLGTLFGDSVYNVMFLGGNGSFVGQYQRESFQNILEDAEADFHHSRGAIIDIASHTSGQHVSERHVTLTGTIESGTVLAKRLRIFVLGKMSINSIAECEIGEDGKFSQVIILQGGENHLMFEVDGALFGEVYFPNISHNMTVQDFVLNCDVETSVILVTLTWDTSLTDVDLYVVDPTGDFSAFYHPNTADGGALDVDDTDGFGPEHWTLLTTDNIRYGEPYKIRVHYYYSGTDNGVRRTNYSVGVKLYEGTERENVLSFRGTLSLSNSENSEPNGIGADWRNITSIVLTQDESVSEPSASISPQGVINITTPIPSKEDIIKAKSK